MASSTRTVTYYDDVADVISGKCSTCHFEGGVAPFALTSTGAIVAAAPAIRVVVEDKTMPPWPPDPCCQEYLDDRSLTPREREDIVHWIDQGMPMGQQRPIAPPPAQADLTRVDVTVQMPTPYEARQAPGSTDDLRCFLIDWPMDTKSFVTGVEIRPGNSKLVHHAILYSASASDRGAFEDLDAKDAAPGWPCPGGIGARATGALAGWAPGFRGRDFPEGVGLEVEADTVLVLNMHYDTSVIASGVDQTAVDLKLESEVAFEATNAVVFHPQWIFGNGLDIPAGTADTTYAYQYDPSGIYRGSIEILNVNLHMHELGTRGLLGVLRKSGEYECILDVPRWDYDWQSEYWLSQPMRIDPGDKLYVECGWDNTRGTDDVIWGNDGEMCIGFFLIREL